MDRVGELLKKTREQQHRTLSDIADVTRISKSTLAAIEEGKDGFLPPPSYVRGFLRLYATELSLDPEEVLQLYETQMRNDRKWEPHKELQPEPGRARKQWLLAGAAAAVVLCVLVAFALIHRDTSTLPVSMPEAVPESHTTIPAVPPAPQPEPAAQPEIIPAPLEVASPEAGPDTGVPAPEEPVAETAPEEPVAEAVPEDLSVAQEPHTRVAAPEPGQFSVRFAASELTWMRIASDDREPFEVMLRPGETYSTEARRQMEVRIGNAGGVTVFYNDLPVRLPDGKDQPVNVSFPEDAPGGD